MHKEMLFPGNIDGIGTVRIVEKESIVPHFDIVRVDGSKVTLMIERPMYMYKQELLSEQEIEIFNDWIKQPSESSCGLCTNWDNIIFCWYGLYGVDSLDWDYDKGIPDYSNII